MNGAEPTPMIDYRFDKDIPPDKLLALYRAGDFNQWYTERNAHASLNHCYLIVSAWIDADLVGTVSVLSDGVNYAHIDDLLVHPSFRNRGIGSGLLQQALKRIEPLNLKFVQLIPVPGREPFFAKLGFRVIPDHKVMELPTRSS